MNSLPDSKHPITVYKEGELTKLKSGLSKEDQEIATRLQHLKASKQSDTSEDEIRARLAKLKGTDINPPNSNAVYVKPAEADAIQEQNLLKQMSEELDLEKDMPNPDDELAARLAKLKGVDVEQIKNPGKGLNKKPEGLAKPIEKEIDLEKFMSKESGGSSNKVNDEIVEEELNKEIASINKELSEMKAARQSKTNDEESDEQGWYIRKFS